MKNKISKSKTNVNKSKISSENDILDILGFKKENQGDYGCIQRKIIYPMQLDHVQMLV